MPINPSVYVGVFWGFGGEAAEVPILFWKAPSERAPSERS